jgi:hypothetical protein
VKHTSSTPQAPQPEACATLVFAPWNFWEVVEVMLAAPNTGLVLQILPYEKKCFLAMWQKNKSINIYQLCIMDQSGYTEKAAGIHHIIMLLTYFLDNVL